MLSRNSLTGNPLQAEDHNGDEGDDDEGDRADGDERARRGPADAGRRAFGAGDRGHRQGAHSGAALGEHQLVALGPHVGQARLQVAVPGGELVDARLAREGRLEAPKSEEQRRRYLGDGVAGEELQHVVQRAPVLGAELRAERGLQHPEPAVLGQLRVAGQERDAVHEEVGALQRGMGDVELCGVEAAVLGGAEQQLGDVHVGACVPVGQLDEVGQRDAVHEGADAGRLRCRRHAEGDGPLGELDDRGRAGGGVAPVRGPGAQVIVDEGGVERGVAQGLAQRVAGGGAHAALHGVPRDDRRRARVLPGEAAGGLPGEVHRAQVTVVELGELGLDLAHPLLGVQQLQVLGGGLPGGDRVDEGGLQDAAADEDLALPLPDLGGAGEAAGAAQRRDGGGTAPAPHVGELGREVGRAGAARVQAHAGGGVAGAAGDGVKEHHARQVRVGVVVLVGGEGQVAAVAEDVDEAAHERGGGRVGLYHAQRRVGAVHDPGEQLVEERAGVGHRPGVGGFGVLAQRVQLDGGEAAGRVRLGGVEPGPARPAFEAEGKLDGDDVLGADERVRDRGAGAVLVVAGGHLVQDHAGALDAQVGQRRPLVAPAGPGDAQREPLVPPGDRGRGQRGGVGPHPVVAGGLRPGAPAEHDLVDPIHRRLLSCPAGTGRAPRSSRTATAAGAGPGGARSPRPGSARRPARRRPRRRSAGSRR
ncbi:hypothetical protein [Dactylosporangium darangshiense]|uniref:hypothetical protein n=1 Tax=Dactylosporangium darangshiense TaxID=579108 RepID=UPI00363D5066